MPLKALLSALFLLSVVLYSQDELNLAHPDTHSYIEHLGSRDQHLYTDAEVNEARIYNFYQRQADHYMEQGSWPEILPAFPGLDAGLHGHWGLHSENDNEDGRWNDIDMGPVWRQTFRTEKLNIGKAVSIRLAAENGISTTFDPQTLSYRVAWDGDFIEFDPFRWGTSRNALPKGDVWLADRDDSPAWITSSGSEKSRYNGFFRHGDRAVFFYEIDGKKILDSPWSPKNEKGIFLRTLSFPDGFGGGKHRLGSLPENRHLVTFGEGIFVRTQNGVTWLEIPQLPNNSSVGLAIGNASVLTDGHARYATDLSLNELTQGGPVQWPELITTSGERSHNPDSKAYVIDTISVPFENPYKSVMQLSSIGFLEDGSALVTTLAGDMWKVVGLDDNLNNVTWKRFATGLNQPMGMHIDEDGIFVMERGQITRLHDLNNDDEADFYENWADDFDGRDKSHSHTFGLVRDDEGAFYFVNWKDIYRTGPDRLTDIFAYGVRNCMGIGMDAAGNVLVGPQEGTDTPASMVIDVHEGEFYGHPGDGPVSQISPPLCFIPRGIDNSTGGFLSAETTQWGPLNKQTIGLSYGYSTHYLVLRDETTKRHQGAVVPLEGDFQSGVMRGDFSPIDGQLYAVGIDGWGDYSVMDGCIQRVRYTGEALRKPIGFQVHSNGLRIDFDVEINETTAADINNFFVQQWDYEYANRYGSPEFSHRTPDSLGHDVLTVRSVQRINEGRSLFLEIPSIEPVMQMYVRMHLQDTEGVAFKTDLFPSILELGGHYTAPGLLPASGHKHGSIHLRINSPKIPSGVTESGEFMEGERTIVLRAGNTLQFDTNLIEAKAGEYIKLVFENPDVMPHNVVFCTEGNLKKVGELAFAMLNDPKVAEKHYTPDIPEIIANTYLVYSGGTHVLHFQAPEEPGDHHFVCTFPGHWMTMNGIFRVSK